MYDNNNNNNNNNDNDIDQEPSEQATSMHLCHGVFTD